MRARPIELGNAPERLARHGRLVRRVQLKKPSAGMDPASRKRDVASVELLESSIAVSLEDTFEPNQVRGRSLRLAVGVVEVDDNRRECGIMQFFVGIDVSLDTFSV